MSFNLFASSSQEYEREKEEERRKQAIKANSYIVSKAFTKNGQNIWSVKKKFIKKVIGIKQGHKVWYIQKQNTKNKRMELKD